MRPIMVVMVVGLMAAACAPAAPDREVRLARLDAEQRSLESTFEQLEDRLLVNQARVRFWEDMRTRHESVSAVACASLGQHAADMAMRAPRPTTTTLDRKRLASADAGPGERAPAHLSGRGGE